MSIIGKPENTRERLIFSAMELFYTHGYGATSVAQILEKSGVGSGSLYYHFKDKADLALAVADQYHKMLFDVLFAPVYEQEEDPVERIFIVLDNYRSNLIQSEFQYGCPIGSLALELAGTLPEVEARLMDNFDGWIEEVEKLLRSAADRFHEDTDFTAVARFVLTTMEGAVMLSRTAHDIRYFDDAISQLRRYVDLLQPAD